MASSKLTTLFFIMPYTQFIYTSFLKIKKAVPSKDDTAFFKVKGQVYPKTKSS